MNYMIKIVTEYGEILISELIYKGKDIIKKNGLIMAKKIMFNDIELFENIEISESEIDEIKAALKNTSHYDTYKVIKILEPQNIEELVTIIRESKYFDIVGGAKDTTMLGSYLFLARFYDRYDTEPKEYISRAEIREEMKNRSKIYGEKEMKEHNGIIKDDNYIAYLGNDIALKQPLKRIGIDMVVSDEKKELKLYMPLKIEETTYDMDNIIKVGAPINPSVYKEEIRKLFSVKDLDYKRSLEITGSSLDIKVVDWNIDIENIGEELFVVAILNINAELTGLELDALNEEVESLMCCIDGCMYEQDLKIDIYDTEKGCKSYEIDVCLYDEDNWYLKTKQEIIEMSNIKRSVKNMKLELKKNAQSEKSVIFDISSGRLKLEENLSYLGVTQDVYIENIYTDDNVKISEDVKTTPDKIILLSSELEKLNSDQMKILEFAIASESIEDMSDIIEKVYNLEIYSPKVNLKDITNDDLVNIYSGQTRIDEFMDIARKARRRSKECYKDIEKYAIYIENDKQEPVPILIPNNKYGIDRILKITGNESLKDVNIIDFSNYWSKPICNMLINDIEETGGTENIEKYMKALEKNIEKIYEVEKINNNSKPRYTAKNHIKSVIEIFEIDNIQDFILYIDESANFKLKSNIKTYKDYGQHIKYAEDMDTEKGHLEIGRDRLMENGGLIYNNNVIEYSGNNSDILMKLKELGANIEIEQKLQANKKQQVMQ